MKKNQSGFAHFGIVALMVLVLSVIAFTGYKVSTRQENKSTKTTPVTDVSKLPQNTSLQSPKSPATKPAAVDVSKPIPAPPTKSAYDISTAIGTVRTFVDLVKKGDYNSAGYYITTPMLFGLQSMIGNPNATNGDFSSACSSNLACPVLISTLSVGDNYTTSPYVGILGYKGVTLGSQLSNVNGLASRTLGNEAVSVSLINVDNRWLIDNASINGKNLH